MGLLDKPIRIAEQPAEKKVPIAGSDPEREAFRKIQQLFAEQYEKVFPDKLAPKTIVIIPSLSLDQQILAKISGINYYEERLLCMLMLLRMPRTHVVYVTSMPVDPVIIDYYLHLLPGITGYHAKKRLHLLSCYDASPRSLTEKILERPRLIERIKSAIPDSHVAHLACFNVTGLERTLSVNLGIPVYGCDPDLYELGNKSNSRKLFKECGLTPPPGYEDLYTEKDIVRALTELKKQNPGLKQAVIKINEGFSGEGNAIYSYEGIGPRDDIGFKVNSYFYARLKTVAQKLKLEAFLEKFRSEGGIVEEFLEGDVLTSPSVQCRVNPVGECTVISSHDQELGGDSKQIFLGAYFPAHPDYAADIGVMGMQIAEAFRDKGVLGRFGIDFISVKNKKGWSHYPIEINLRKGGTTHPYIMLQFLTDGTYDYKKGLYFNANGQSRYYFCSDNLRSEQFHGITPPDLIDIAMFHDLHYDGTLQEGVMFHLIGALSQYGKLGLVCIGNSRKRVAEYYTKTVEVLKLETVHLYHH